jgi:hypothetical protein
VLEIKQKIADGQQQQSEHQKEMACLLIIYFHASLAVHGVTFSF